MSSLKDKITLLQKTFSESLIEVTTLDQLEELRLQFLSRNGTLASLMVELKSLSLEEKKEFGPLVNKIKEFTAHAFEEKKNKILAQIIQEKLGKDRHFDVTAYKPHAIRGSLHPITQIYKKVCTILSSMGYTIVDGPEVETEFYNFEALNIPKDHPARDMWDTFWLTKPGYLLRTHTSSVQIHSMQQRQLPLALVAPGRVYRHEATDATHDFMFNQIEGLVIDKNISMSHLLATLKTFFRTLFNRNDLEIRVRPSYFPFVEPGIEIDISCPFCTTGCSICKKTGLIEMGGAGLVHPNVLECCKIDSKEYSGFAFGLGIDRIAMLMYSINDIRLFSSGKIEFLKQFE